MDSQKQNHNSYYFLTTPSKENYVLFLSNMYLKHNRSKLSVDDYINLIKKGATYVGIAEDTFFNTKDVLQLKLWAAKLYDVLKNRRDEALVQDIFAAYNSYLNFARRCNGHSDHKDFFKK